MIRWFARGKGTKKSSGMDEVNGRGRCSQFFTDLYIFPSANPRRVRIKLFGYRLWELGCCLDETYLLLAAFIGIGGMAVWLGFPRKELHSSVSVTPREGCGVIGQ